MNKLSELSRREFIRKTSCGIAGTLAYQLIPSNAKNALANDKTPRAGMGNIFLKNGKPLMVVAEGNDRDTRLKKGLEKIGGLEKLVKGKNVILKPNAVAPTPYPVCTEPDFLISVGKSIRDSGAKKVSIYDGVPERTFRIMKLYEKAPRIGIEVLAVDFTKSDSFTPVEKKSWEIMKTIDISKYIKEADVVINIPNIKRHGDAGFTCAMKNHFGSVYGPNRWDAHNKLHKGQPVDSGIVDESFRIPFKKVAVEFSDAVRCELNIVDAQDLLIKAGPFLDTNNAEIKKGVNKLIICGDIIATDAYCSALLAKHDPTYSTDIWEPALKHGEILGLGTSDIGKVELIEV